MRFINTTGHGLVLLASGLTLAACSGGSGDFSSGTAASPAVPSSATSSLESPAATDGSAGSGGPAASDAKITKNWEAFFSGKTTAATRVSLLQDGQKYAALINSMASSPLADSASASVQSVRVISATQAAVSYTIMANGSPVLPEQKGVAIYQGGTWKVGDASFCALLTLENAGEVAVGCAVG